MDNHGGSLVPGFPLAQAVHEADGIINLPKMKAHQLTRITGAVKNLFGCIPGKRKALYHVQFQDVIEFSGLLAELNLRLPDDIDYRQVRGLSAEVQQKLNAARPQTIGPASRMSGVTPAAISLLLVQLKRGYREQRSA